MEVNLTWPLCVRCSYVGLDEKISHQTPFQLMQSTTPMCLQYISLLYAIHDMILFLWVILNGCKLCTMQVLMFTILELWNHHALLQAWSVSLFISVMKNLRLERQYNKTQITSTKLPNRSVSTEIPACMNWYVPESIA